MLQKATANFKFTKIISVLREKGSLNLSLKKKKKKIKQEGKLASVKQPKDCRGAQELPGP